MENSLGLTNTGQTALEGLRASTANVSASGVALIFDPSSLPVSLPAGQTANIRLTAKADPIARGGNLALEVAESHGFTRHLPIIVQVSAAQPIPVATPQSFQIGVLSGQIRTQPITLENKGFAPWSQVTLTTATLDWVHIDGSLNLGDIPPGGNANFSLRFAPPLDIPTTAYVQNPLIEVRSANAATIPINVAVVVTSSKKGGVAFNIINGDQPLGAGGQGVAVAGAGVTLTSLDVAGLSFSAIADQNGIAQFAELPSGNYSYTAQAQGFQPVSDTTPIEPGLTKSVQIVLITQTVTYTWSVTPTTIVDQFDITLNAQFKTDVPAPAVVIDPTFLTMSVESNVDAFGQFTVTNLGLVSAFNVTLETQSPDGEVQFELPFTTIPELKPKQSVTVPFKVRHGQGALAHCHTPSIAAKFGYVCAAGVPVTGNSNTLGMRVCTPPAAAVATTPPSVGISATPGSTPPSTPPTGSISQSVIGRLLELIGLQQTQKAVSQESCERNCQRTDTNTEKFLLFVRPDGTPVFAWRLTCTYVCPPAPGKDQLVCFLKTVFNHEPSIEEIEAVCPRVAPESRVCFQPL